MYKLIKVFGIAFVALLSFVTLCSCVSKEIDPRFLNPLDEVCKVDIVVYYESEEAYEAEYYNETLKIEPAPVIVKTLSDEEREAVIASLKTIKVMLPGMDTFPIDDGYVGLMLTYANDDYEIVSLPSSFQHREADNMNWRQARYRVDRDTFAQLLVEYSDGFWVYGDRFWIETEKDDLCHAINASGGQAE